MDSPPSALLDMLSRRYQNCALGDMGCISRNSDHDGIRYSRNRIVCC